MKAINIENIKLRPEQFSFVEQHQAMGFENINALISFAINFLQQEVTKPSQSSQELFTQLYTDLYSLDDFYCN